MSNVLPEDRPTFVLDNLRAAYHVLTDRVNRALRTQIGDTQRLQEQKAEVLDFLASAAQVRNSLTDTVTVVLTSHSIPSNFQHQNSPHSSTVLRTCFPF